MSDILSVTPLSRHPTVIMLRSRLLLFAALILASGCRLEDHTPTGSRLDEAQVREVILEFYRGIAAGEWAHVRTFFAPGAQVSYPLPGDSAAVAMVSADSVVLGWARLAGDSAAGEVRITRADFRQVDGVAAVWASVHMQVPWERRLAVPEDGETVEHLVLHRTAYGWRIVLLTLPWVPR